MEYQKQIMRNLTAEVVIVGGGTAGVFAAISAARSGANTILLEKNSMLGGTITVAGVLFPGLFYAWGNKIISGPCWESIERTVALGGAVLPTITKKPERHYLEQIRLNQFIYTHVLHEMCKESGVMVLANTMLSDAQEQEDGIRLIATDKSGLFSIHAKKVIDATGDANLAGMMGYPFYPKENVQPATLQNRLGGYDYEQVNLNQVRKVISDAGMNAEQILHFLRIKKIDNHIPAPVADTSWGKTNLETEALASLAKLYQLLRQVEGLENLCIEWIASETGVRETNRIIGEATVTAEDYLKGIHYPDAICYAFYPIDLHVPDGIDQTFLTEDTVPQIPYRALIPKSSRHLLCAGRCISSDRYANSAIRVQAPCMAMGQAAGCAAALCAKQNIPVLKLDYQNLKKALSDLGAIVPKH